MSVVVIAMCLVIILVLFGVYSLFRREKTYSPNQVMAGTGLAGGTPGVGSDQEEGADGGE
ncbi:hypothetical protein ABLT31_03545 [Ammoniphilus sp. 3BR4]